MDFEFTKQEKAWREEAAQFFQKEAPPERVERLCREQDCANPYDHELYMKMAQKGWFGLTWPKAYGGKELPKIYEAILQEEMGYWGIPIGTWNVFINSVVFLGNSLVKLATEEQKKRWVPLIVTGQFRTSNGLTEPEAGTDAASAKTTALEDGDEFVVNGTKIFNYAHNAEWITTLLRTDPAVAKHRGLSILLIDLRSPGVTVRPTYKTLAGWIRAEVNFEDVRVPKVNLIGELNKGWDYLMGYLAEERVSLSAMGRCKRIVDDLIGYIKAQRPELGKVPAVRHALADIWTELQTSFLLTYWVIWLAGQGKDFSTEAGLVKVITSESANTMANLALEILGEYGQLTSSSPYRQWLPLEGKCAEWYADIRVDQVAGGSSEVMRTMMATRGLQLPRAGR